MEQITSLQNPRVKEAVKLRDRRNRDKTSLFLIEGYREISRAVDGERSINTLFICPQLFLGSNESSLIKKVDTETVKCSEAVFRKLSYRDRPDGLLAVAPQQHLSLSVFKQNLPPNPLLLIAEAIEKPGNLGTILRSADAVGADGVIVCDKCTDIHNPNVVRASVGTLFNLPVIEAKGEEVLAWLKKEGIAIVAATPHATTSYTEADLSKPVAIAMGCEQYGLSKQWMEAADVQVKLPMRGCADSLNVSMATVVLLYEVLRQRGVQ